MATLYLSVRTSLANARRVFGLLDERPSFLDAPDAVAAGPLQRAIELRDVSYTPEGRAVLEHVDLVIPKGGRIVIHGPSGAGKTTLLHLIAGLERASAGRVLIDGTDLARLKGESWRRRLGVVPQDPVLLNGSVRSNLLFARPDADEERLIAVLREALLWQEPRLRQRGLDTAVGNRGELLSGGERQRLAIARALLADPELLLLDEPTSMLDTAGRGKIVETIESVSQDRTLVVATHDTGLRRIATHLYEMAEGRLSALDHERSRASRSPLSRSDDASQ
jgi:ABC-type multidrug transport system fused ATPase/permease subunit